jgi:hypothetical protein
MQRLVWRICRPFPLISLEFASRIGLVLQLCQYIINIPALLPTYR